MEWRTTMTDNEIIKALECCNRNGSCSKCPYDRARFEAERDCASEMTADALDLINRLKEENNALISAQETLQKHIEKQNAENERLQCQVNRLKKYDEERDIRLHARLIATARTEAIKEFAERLKGKTYPFPCAIGVEHAVTIRAIDDLVKEMVGDTE